MKRTLLNVLITSVFAVYLGACIPEDSAPNIEPETESPEPTEGLATFYHSITDAGMLHLEGDVQNYRSVNYQQFGSGIPLHTGNWNLSIKHLNTEDTSASNELLRTTFEVYDTLERNIYAMVGSIIDDTIDIHHLQTAVDKNSSAYESDSEEVNEDLIWINAAHIHPYYQSSALHFYLLEGDETVENSTPEFTLNYGDYSSPAVLSTNDQKLLVVNSESGEVLFTAYEFKTLLDQFRQTLMFTQHPNTSTASQIVYYYVSGHEIWADHTDTENKNRTDVTLFNSVWGAEVSNAETIDSAAPETIADHAVIYGSASPITTIKPGIRDIEVEFSNTFEVAGLSMLSAEGYLETLIVSGRLGMGEKLSAAVISDNKRSLVNKSRIRFINLAYMTNSDAYEDYNVHLVSSRAQEDLTSRTPEIWSIDYLEQVEVERTINNDEANTYELTVTNLNNTEVVATTTLSLSAGENKQIGLIPNEDSTGYQLVDMTPEYD